jgi:diamine N-acetyltransferase
MASISLPEIHNYLDVKTVFPAITRRILWVPSESAVSGIDDYPRETRARYPDAMGELRLQELDASNIVAANTLTLKPGQEQFIAPVSYSAAMAVINPATAWQRVVTDGDSVVGFIMGNFDPAAEHDEFRAILWRINVDAEGQGQGIGTFAVQALADEARARGLNRINVIWEHGELGPEAFFLHSGFVPIGETQYGEVIGALDL